VFGSKITIFEESERFVDEVIASFDYECVLETPEDIAQLRSNTLTLQYEYAAGSTPGSELYEVGVLAVDEDLSLQTLVDGGWIDLEYYPSSDLDALSNQLRTYSADNLGEELIIASTGAVAELFLAEDVDILELRGTDNVDTYTLTGLNGRVNEIRIYGGGGNDVIRVDADQANGATLSGLDIQGQGGSDYIRIDPYLLGAAAAGSYSISGGDDHDRIKLLANDDDSPGLGETLFAYSGLTIDGGAGDDKLFGHTGTDEILGGAGDDVILGYFGDDRIVAGLGDDIVGAGAGNDSVWGDEQGESRSDGADNISGDDGDDTIVAGGGDDIIDAGAGDDSVDAGAGDDSIVAGQGEDVVLGAAGDDVLSWEEGDGSDNFSGGDGEDQLAARGYVLDQVAFTRDPDNYVLDDGGTDVVQVRAGAVGDDAGNDQVEIDWTHGADARVTLTLGEVENLDLDTGVGADDILIGSLETTSAEKVSVNSGEARGVVDQSMVSRDASGDPVGQDLVVDGQVGDSFVVRVGPYGEESGPIEIAGFENDAGETVVDGVATALNIAAELRSLLDDDDIIVSYSETLGYQITNLGDIADALILTSADIELSASRLQLVELSGAVGDSFRLKLGASGTPTESISFADDGDGNVEPNTTAASIQAALQDLGVTDGSGNLVGVDVLYDADEDRYRISGLPTDAGEVMLDTDGSDAGVSLTAQSYVQELAIDGVAGQVFDLRFGDGGTATAMIELAGDALTGALDTAATAQAIQDALQGLDGALQVAYVARDGTDVAGDALSGVYRVSGFTTDRDGLQLASAGAADEVDATGTTVQTLSLSGPANSEFYLRFGSGGALTERTLLVVDESGDSVLFQPGDFTDASTLAETLREQDDVVSIYLWQAFSADVQAVLEDAALSDADYAAALAEGLNDILLAGSIFTVARFADVDTRAETDRLRLSSPTGGELYYLNRLLLEDAYAGLIEQTRTGGIDTALTASDMQTVLRELMDDSGIGVEYDADVGAYLVSGLSESTQALQVVSDETDLSAVVSVTRYLALDGTEGQQFQVVPGAAGKGTGLVSIGADDDATAANLAAALQASFGAGIEVGYDTALGAFAITGLGAPTDALELVASSSSDGVQLTSQPGRQSFRVFQLGDDGAIDSVVIEGSDDGADGGADDYLISTIRTVDITGSSVLAMRYEQLNGEFDDLGLAESHVVVDVLGLEAHDYLRLNTLGGADRVDATGIADHLVDEQVIDGGADDDVLVGTDLVATSDVIIGGSGSDRITAGGGEDEYYELTDAGGRPRNSLEDVDEGLDPNADGDVDTLVETRDADFWLTDNSLLIDDSDLFAQYGPEQEYFGDIFEAVELYGLSGSNYFNISNWSDSGVIDGAKGGDIYELELADSSSGQQFFDIRDSGASGIDSLTFKGSSGDDIIQFDTVYDPDLDPDDAFTDPRWTSFGGHGDGLIIGHFNPTLNGYEQTSADADEDAFFEVTASSLEASSDFQVINYFTVEEVRAFAGDGDDTIVSDSTSAEIDLFGNDGDDQFFIGTVLETEDVLVEGQIVTVVRQITQGAVFNGTTFYGGDGDDYFEVNHNQAEINLFGDNGDDTFLVRALLTLDEDGGVADLDSSTATVSGTFGDDSDLGTDTSTDTREVDIDSLVYVENANINIDGGAGFDSVSVVGTVLSDTFYVFTELDVDSGETVQRIYGAGVKLQELVNIERLQLLTGGGDDTVYLYGVDMGVIGDLVIKGRLRRRQHHRRRRRAGDRAELPEQPQSVLLHRRRLRGRHRFQRRLRANHLHRRHALL
jgi:hypothetical protein